MYKTHLQLAFVETKNETISAHFDDYTEKTYVSAWKE